MQPSGPNPTLRKLSVLVGEWEMNISLSPSTPARVTFEWQLGGAVLVENMGNNATWIIGRDESVGTYCVLYFDARGVSRVYEMSLQGGIWKIWRNREGFSQRFTATISDDNNTISGRWEKSIDGSTWERDFDVVYKRIKKATG